VRLQLAAESFALTAVVPASASPYATPFAFTVVTGYSRFMMKASSPAWSLAVVMATAACATPKGPEPQAAALSPSTAPAAPAAATAPAPPSSAAPTDVALLAAGELHRSAIVVDTHNDVTQRLALEDADLSRPFPDAQTDIPRMQAGGLDAEFLSVWVSPQLYPGDKAYTYSIAQFDAIDRLVSRNAGVAVLARSVEEIRSAAAANKIAFLIGVEGAHGLGDGPDERLMGRLHEFYDRGARYMTLTWSNSNRLGGSSGDAGKTKGLTPFGLRMVRVMNELGMMVDVSHVSDATFFDAVKASTKPVLASHSSSRALCDHPRNMTDDMLRAVRDNGGAVCVNFGQDFLDAGWHEQWSVLQKSFAAEMGKLAKEHPGDPKATQLAFLPKYRALAAQLPRVPASRVVDHIEHIAHVAGVEHVCLGSDFDGIPLGPAGLDDVSKFPFITEELARRGFSPDDIRKVLGENVLRVLAANERKP
jgi:membrane dipeptidase